MILFRTENSLCIVHSTTQWLCKKQQHQMTYNHKIMYLLSVRVYYQTQVKTHLLSMEKTNKCICGHMLIYTFTHKVIATRSNYDKMIPMYSNLLTRASGHGLVVHIFSWWSWLTLLCRSFFAKALEAFIESLDAQCYIISGYSNSRGCVKVRARIGICVRHEATKRVSAHSLLHTQRDDPAMKYYTNEQVLWKRSALNCTECAFIAYFKS